VSRCKAQFVNVVRSVSPSVVQIEDQQGLAPESSSMRPETSSPTTTSSVAADVVHGDYVDRYPVPGYARRLVSSRRPCGDQDLGAHLRPATFEDSSTLQVGDLAIAIGNPLVAAVERDDGIVSAFRAAVPESGNVTLPSVIQTSAAINPGNSGGALVDIEGRVIGIPTLAATDPNSAAVAPGIGFAIPSNLVTEIAAPDRRPRQGGRLAPRYLGIQVGDTNGSGAYVGSGNSGWNLLRKPGCTPAT